MSSEPLTPGAADGPGGEPGESGGSSAVRTFVGLFVVPLLVVLICVGVFIGFGWIAYEHQDVDDYLNDLRSSWRPRRAQAAYELGKILVADPDALAGRPDVRQEVRRLFEESEEGEIRRYLALVLGHTRDREALPLLERALAETEDSQSRIYLLWSLGAIGDPGAVPALAASLADEDAGIRKTAAFALGQLGDPAVAGRLEALLEDGVADVRWNAALALTRLGSTAAVPELYRMLDRRLTDRVPGITAEQQEDAMVGAIRALVVAEGRRAETELRRAASEDPSLKVRQAALEALAALEAAAEPAGADAGGAAAASR